MASINEKLNYINETKSLIKDKLNDLGSEINNETTFREYAEKIEDLYEEWPKTNNENTIISLENTRKGKMNLQLKGNTSQNGTPTPTSPIPVNVVSGDNEMVIQNANLWCSEWEQGIVDGTTGQNATNTTCVRTKDYIPVISNQHYAIKRSTSNSYTNIRGYGSDKRFLGTGGDVITLISGSSVGNPMNNISQCIIAPKENVYYLRWNDFSNDLNVQYMMIKGDTIPNDYVPYEIDTYNIDLPVENLFDKSNANIINCNVGDNNKINSSSNAKTLYITCKPNTTYTISKIQSARFRIATSQIIPANEVDISGFTYNDSATSLTITTNENANYLCVYYFLNGTDTLTEQQILYSIQIEVGSKANTYTPYGTTPIEMYSSADGTIRDSFLHDKALDKWYKYGVIGKIVLNGSEAWETQNINVSGKVRFRVNDIIAGVGYPTNTLPIILSNNYQAQTGDSIWFGTQGIGISTSGTIIFIYDNTYNTSGDLSAFKTWLSTHNVSVYYILATPTNIEITYQPLIDQLNAIEKAMSKENQTNISQVNNDLLFIISANALLKNSD